MIDLAVTSYGQATIYWQGQLDAVNEANPVVNWAMVKSQSGLFIITFLWLMLVIALVYWCPRPVATFIAVAIVIGNSFGACSWLSYYSFWYAIGLIVFNGLILTVCLEKNYKAVPIPLPRDPTTN